MSFRRTCRNFNEIVIFYEFRKNLTKFRRIYNFFNSFKITLRNITKPRKKLLNFWSKFKIFFNSLLSGQSDTSQNPQNQKSRLNFNNDLNCLKIKFVEHIKIRKKIMIFSRTIFNR